MLWYGVQTIPYLPIFGEFGFLNVGTCLNILLVLGEAHLDSQHVVLDVQGTGRGAVNEKKIRSERLNLGKEMYAIQNRGPV